MIDRSVAASFLDFGSRMGQGRRADEQLDGAVALHNLLRKNGIAYLADEVGMGKTYVALGVMALFRHFKPDFRVMVIAPRENIQGKWIKELRNFVAYNVRFPDLHVKAIDGRPARPQVSCGNLLELVRESVTNPNRDFFVRLTSFSLPLSGRNAVDPEAARRLRDGLRTHIPWLPDEVFDLRNKQSFKDNVARAICCALPVFDLVIIDEAHNLKHGFTDGASARNRVLSLVFGHPDGEASPKLFPGYGPRARHVLCLSATPIEETYTHLFNQLFVFGKAAGFDDLRRRDLEEDRKKAAAARCLVRRVTAMRVGEQELTKNLYRREWRQGGVVNHDEPIRVEDPRQRLVVALVQKKVSELLSHERFNSSFQIGMLASFESFLETSRLKRDASEEQPTFDDPDQADDDSEKEGIDVRDVNRIAKSYKTRFGREMPHPKMDEIVKSLAGSWRNGTKSLVFVRRVASVKELKRKLDELYDDWLIGRLREELPSEVQQRFSRVVRNYEAVQLDTAAAASGPAKDGASEDEPDRGGNDTFFAWFFRGEGPKGVISGANVQQRFIQRGAAYATFFEDNYVADVLGCAPGGVGLMLSGVLGESPSNVREKLRRESRRFLSGKAAKHARADRFEAVQAAAIEWLKEVPGPYQESARTVWHERFETSVRWPHASDAPDIGDWLELRTFFTELRHRPQLRERLWPEPAGKGQRESFHERQLRAQLLAATARLGHAFIDLYVMTIQRLRSLDLRAQEADEVGVDTETARIHEYLDLLQRQMETSRVDRSWGAFDELGDVADNFDLILDVNAPEARNQRLDETARAFGSLMRQQQPVGGMSGQVNQTMVRQFRMPGYPLVLITTDLLQEGEDLHTFCASVHHYGISWTPSSMEQRIGRIDRVRSLADRRLGTLARPLDGGDMLQVYYPHLEDTVEVLQVQRVLERMNVFLRLMHEGLTTAPVEEKRIDVGREIVRGRIVVPQIRERLQSAFPVRQELLNGNVDELAVGPDVAAALQTRFLRLREAGLPDVDVQWEHDGPACALFGTARLSPRSQPFSLVLQTVGDRPLIRCVSPVGTVDTIAAQDEIRRIAGQRGIRVGLVRGQEELTYNLTVEGDVLLSTSGNFDAERVGWLVRKVVHDADILELSLLPNRDEPLTTFRKDLEREVTDAD